MSGSTKAWAMLTARAQRYEISGSAHGALRQADVAAMLSLPCSRTCRGLAEREVLAAMVCDAGVASGRPRLEVLLSEATIGLAIARDWDLRRGGLELLVVKLPALAIDEVTGRGAACPICEGEGIIISDGGISRRQCEDCSGRGKLILTQKSRAELIGIEPMSWSRTWGDRYDEIYKMLTEWQETANRHLSRHLRKHRAPGL